MLDTDGADEWERLQPPKEFFRRHFADAGPFSAAFPLLQFLTRRGGVTRHNGSIMNSGVR
jgi:hypothetical protein